MLISTKGRYALRVMVDLCEHSPKDFCPLQEIADRQEISKEYLNSILKILVQNGLLNSLRGKGGGYCLTKTPEEYTVGEILWAAEEDLSPVPCVMRNGASCPNSSHCRTHPMWMKLDSLIQDFFSGITLKDLMETK